MSFTTRKLMILSTMVLLLMILFSSNVAFAEGTNNWINKKPMAIARTDHQVAVVNGKIYAIGGGNSNTGVTTSVEEYDSATNKWTTKASMQTARIRHQVAVVDGKIYAIGGNNNSATSLNSVEEYDPATNKWTTKAAMSTARHSHEVTVVNGKIYAIGGYSSNGVTNTVEEYDPATNKWTTKASMLNARYSNQVSVVDGKIYVIGGCNSTAINSVEEYNPTTNKWTTKSSMITGRYHNQGVVVDGKILTIGGSSANGDLNSVEEYDPATNKWTTKASMAIIRQYHKVVVVNGKIYAIGGYSARAETNLVEEYDNVTNKWTTKEPMNTGRYRYQVAVVDGKIYAIGGATTTNFLNSVEEYTTESTAPSAPINLTATAGNAKVDLSWNAVDGATSYNIKRSTTAGGPYTTIATSSAITYSDTTAVNGTTYYYVVTAVNAGGESIPSNEVSVTIKEPAITNQLKLVLEVKEEKQLSTSDELSDNTEMDWTSYDSTVAAADANGMVKALKPGNTVITCTSKDKSYIEKINVLVVDLQYQLAVDLTIGDTCRLTIDDLSNTTSVTWSSYDPTIATVSAKGKVTAISEGLTYVVASDKDGKEIGRIYIRVRK